MLKSYVQQQIEDKYEGKEIKVVLEELLEKHRGKRNISVVIAAELGRSDRTINNWCRDLGIDLNDYRTPTVTS